VIWAHRTVAPLRTRWSGSPAGRQDLSRLTSGQPGTYAGGVPTALTWSAVQVQLWRRHGSGQCA
jgi:hypothetical protein